MKRNFIFLTIISVFVIILSSCSNTSMARFYVENKTKSTVTNFEIIWTTEDGNEKFLIEQIEPNSRSEYYAAFLQTTDVWITEEVVSDFCLTYELDGKTFDFTDSKTIKYKLNGESWDPEAKFVADETYCIEIVNDGYSIKVQK